MNQNIIIVTNMEIIIALLIVVAVTFAAVKLGLTKGANNAIQKH